MRHPITLILLTLSVLMVAGCSGRVVASGDYVLESSETLCGNLIVFSGDATLEEESRITGSVFMTSGDLNANGDVDGGIFLTSGNVALGPEAVVHGDIWATSGNVQRAEGARVEGRMSTDHNSFPIGGGFIAGIIGTFCALPLVFLIVLISLIVIVVRRRPAQVTGTAASSATSAQPLK